MHKKTTEDFQGSDATLYKNVMVDTCYYAFIQINRHYNTKSEPQCNVNYGLWMLIIYQWGFINYNIYATLVGHVDIGKAIYA